MHSNWKLTCHVPNLRRGGANIYRGTHMRWDGQNHSQITAPLPLRVLYWMKPLSAKSISLDSLFNLFIYTQNMLAVLVENFTSNCELVSWCQVRPRFLLSQLFLLIMYVRIFRDSNLISSSGQNISTSTSWRHIRCTRRWAWVCKQATL